MSGSIFVVGVGRSGTTLLQALLGSHSQIVSMPETGFFRSFVVSNSPLTVRSLNYSEFNRLDGDLLRLIRGMVAENGTDAETVHRKILAYYSERDNAYYALDKDPRLLEKLSRIYGVYPDAKIVHIVRDPRDVLNSKKKAEWSKDRPIWRHLLANYVQMSMGRKFGSALFDSDYIMVKYEELISSTEQVLRTLCHRLELEFEEAMLKHQTTASHVVTQSEMQWKAKVLGAVDQKNMGKWATGLTSFEVLLTEAACKKEFGPEGYVRSNVQGPKILAEIYGNAIRAVGYLYVNLWLRWS